MVEKRIKKLLGIPEEFKVYSITSFKKGGKVYYQVMAYSPKTGIRRFHVRKAVEKEVLSLFREFLEEREERREIEEVLEGMSKEELKELVKSLLAREEMRDYNKGIMVEFNVEKLKEIIKSHPEGIYTPKDSDVPELKDELLKEVVREIVKECLKQGVGFYEDTQIFEKGDLVGVVKKISLVDMESQKTFLELSDVGEATTREMEKGLGIRLAERRALKRALEKVVGRAFVNEALRELELEGKIQRKEEKATQRQIKTINELLQERGYQFKDVVEVLEIKADSLEDLRKSDASKVIDFLKGVPGLGMGL